MRAVRRLHLLDNIRGSRLRLLRWLVPLLLLGVALLLWPYLSLWRLNALVMGQPPAALEPLVDIEAVRDEIRRRLNKDANSHIGEVSDPFIEWIEQGIRRSGDDTLEQGVTLAWLHARLSGHAVTEQGFLPAVSYAFFDSLDGFLVCIGAPDDSPTYLRLQPGLFGWRVTAAYY
jgi:AcrR family transcriptional regulator